MVEKVLNSFILGSSFHFINGYFDFSVRVGRLFIFTAASIHLIRQCVKKKSAIKVRTTMF